MSREAKDGPSNLLKPDFAGNILSDTAYRTNPSVADNCKYKKQTLGPTGPQWYELTQATILDST